MGQRKSEGIVPPLKHKVGDRRGRLVILERIGGTVRCQCDCGNTTIVRLSNILVTESCGCLRVERLKSKLLIHGKRHSRVYRAWQNMRQRCSNAKNKSFTDYGARGISVCTSWEDFPAFLADMGEPPIGMTLERINVNTGYSKSNCIWATRKVQGRNKRDTVFLECGGKRQSISAWAEELGMNYYTMYDRYKRGWDHESIVMTPPKKQGGRVGIL